MLHILTQLGTVNGNANFSLYAQCLTTEAPLNKHLAIHMRSQTHMRTTKQLTKKEVSDDERNSTLSYCNGVRREQGW
jgi:hypothetical protein